MEKLTISRSSSAATASWRTALLLVVAAPLVAISMPPRQALLIGVPLLSAIGCALFFAAPYWGLVVLLLSFYNPAVAFLRLNIEVWSYVLTLGLFGATALAFLLQRRRGLPSSWRGVKAALCALGAVILVAGLYGFFRGNAVRYVVSDLIQNLELVGFFWLTAALLLHYGRLRFILATILVVALVTLAWEQILYFTEGSAFFRLLPQSEALYPAVLGGRHVLAGSSRAPAVLLPIVVSVLLLGWRVVSPWWRACLLGCLGLSAFSVALSFKRTIWGAEILALLVVFVLAFRVLPLVKILRLAILAIAAAGVFVSVLAFTSWNGSSLLSQIRARAAYTITQLQDQTNPGVESRRSEYMVVLHELQEAPFLGKGLGAEYRGHTPGHKLAEKHFMHNTFLAIAFRMGGVGLVVFLAALAYFVLLPVRRLDRRMDRLDQALVIGSLASFCMMAAQGLTMGTFLSHPVSAYGGFFLGMAHYLSTRRVPVPDPCVEQTWESSMLPAPLPKESTGAAV